MLLGNFKISIQISIGIIARTQTVNVNEFGKKKTLPLNVSYDEFREKGSTYKGISKQPGSKLVFSHSQAYDAYVLKRLAKTGPEAKEEWRKTVIAKLDLLRDIITSEAGKKQLIRMIKKYNKCDFSAIYSDIKEYKNDPIFKGSSNLFNLFSSRNPNRGSLNVC